MNRNLAKPVIVRLDDREYGRQRQCDAEYVALAPRARRWVVVRMRMTVHARSSQP